MQDILAFEQQLLATPGLKVPEWLQKTRQVGYKVCRYARPARPAVCVLTSPYCAGCSQSQGVRTRGQHQLGLQ